MTKTIREWLQELDEEHKDKALANFDKYIQNGVLSADTEADNLDEALLGAFYWDDTPEGLHYWMEVSESIDMYNQTLNE